jgi:hypothetical protein
LALIDDGAFQVVRKLVKSGVINMFQFGNNEVLDLVPSEPTSLGNDTDYGFWHAAFGHQCKVNMNPKPYKGSYLLPDCESNFTYNLCALSKSKHKVPKPTESKSRDAFALIHADVCGPFPT